VAKLMRQFDCGEIPIVDSADRPIGVVTDRDIVCRVVAEGQNPAAHTAEQCMTRPVVTVPPTRLSTTLLTMERHQIRRVPVVDDRTLRRSSQADVALASAPVRWVIWCVKCRVRTRLTDLLATTLHWITTGQGG
jgi:CBS domain-containing protein